MQKDGNIWAMQGNTLYTLITRRFPMLKRLFPFALCMFAFLIFSTSSAQQSDAFSKPVGIIRINSNSQSRRLSSIPFVPFNSALNPNDDFQGVFGSQMLGESSSQPADFIFKWDPVSQSFKSAFKVEGHADPTKNGKWYLNDINWTLSSLSLTAGEGFFLQNKHQLDATQPSEANVFFMGKVVLDHDISISIYPNLNMISYPFSTKKPLNNTSMATDGAQGDTAEGENSDTITQNVPDENGFWLNSTDDKWYSGITETGFEFLPGRGVWYNGEISSSYSWNVIRPYTNLFTGTSPEVTNMQLNSAKDEVTLTISCTGATGETLEIFYKDVNDWNEFDSETGWKIAAEDIASNSQTSIFWTDTGQTTYAFPLLPRAKIDRIKSRVYLVVRQDIDFDSDNLSDAREKFITFTDANDNDSDDDSYSDEDEFIWGTSPLFSTVCYYVDDSGDDVANSGLNSGSPKATINAGLTLAKAGYDSDNTKEYAVLVGNGTYSGSGNTAIDFYGYNNIKIIAIDGPAQTTMDCQSANQSFILSNTVGTNMNKVLISGFKIIDSAPAVAASSGMVIDNANSPLIRNCVFNSCTGGGGAVADIDDSTVTFEYCTFTNNANVGTYDGGVLNILSSSVIIDNCNFSGNHSNRYGGAIFVDESEAANNQSLVIKNTLFSNNTANHYGGSIHSADSDVLIENTDFISNNTNAVANRYGGAGYFINSSLSALNCVFRSNQASYFGGALYIKTSTADFSGCLFEQNKNNATADHGGAIYGLTSTITVDETRFLKNITSGHGGAIAGSALDLTVSNSEFTENTCNASATYDGGAIDLLGASRLKISDSCFIENETADSGGAVYMDASGGGHESPLLPGIDFDGIIERCTFQGNKANVTYGGAIRSLDQMLIVDSTVSGNYAKTRGGGIYNSGAGLYIINSTISGNYLSTAVTSQGGGIYANARMNIYNSTIFGNSCKTDGGGIFRNYGTCSIYSSIIAGNDAVSSANDDIKGTVAVFNNSIVGVKGAALFTDDTGSYEQDISADVEALAYNGGPTKTHALKSTCFALDKGANPLTLSYDQRGIPYPRTYGSNPDAGAYEYTKHSLTIAVSVSGSGTTSPAVGEYYYELNTAIPVTAIPGTGQHFVNWTISGNASVTNSTSATTDVILSGKGTVTANFAPDTKTVTFTAGSNGSISGTNPQTVPYAGDCLAVTAVPEAGYHFDSWSGDVTGHTNPLTVTNVTADMNITANFGAGDNTVTFTAGANGSITGATTQSVAHNVLTTPVTAVPNTGYVFIGWSGDYSSNGAYPPTNPLSIPHVLSDMDITANFAMATYTVTFITGANGSLTGTTTQVVNYHDNTTQIEAVSDEWYEFTGWTGDYTGADNPLVISDVIANKNITANFALYDTDGDGISDKEEAEKGYDPNVYTQLYYVDGNIVASGDGLSEATAKKTINEGMSLAKNGIDADNTKEYVVLVKALPSSGVYSGTGNVALDFAGYTFKLIAVEDSDEVIIDCETTSSAFIINNASATDMTGTVISGFTVNNASSATGGAGLLLQNATGVIVKDCVFDTCTITGGDGIVVDCDDSTANFENCEFKNNTTTSSAVHGGVFHLNGSTITLKDCNIHNNSTTGYGGVAYLAAASTLNADNCQFTTNFAKNFGGAIYQTASTTSFTNCTFDGNYNFTASDSGGAIYAIGTSTLTLAGTTFLNNITTAHGGAIYASAVDLNISGCTFTGNTANAGAFDGGAICLLGASTLELSDSIFTGNQAGDDGGAVYFDAAGGGITSSLFSSVDFDGIIERCTFSTNNASDFGGAVRIADDLLITDSTFNANTAERGGAFYHTNDLYLVNSTLSGNSVTLYGGAIYTQGIFNAYNCTVYGNSSDNMGGAQYCYSGTVNYYSSIVAGNSATSGSGPDIKGGVAMFDHSIISNATTATFTDFTGSYVQDISADIETLANNGGLTATHALESTSFALDKGSNPLNLSYDQRGISYSRTYNSTTDVGAFEYFRCSLTISINGTGTTDPVPDEYFYEINSQIPITATPGSGRSFQNWTTTGNVSVADANSATTNILITGNGTLVANFADIPYSLTVENGSGSGSFTIDSSVNIVADAPPAGSQFLQWTTASGGAFVDPDSANTNYTMPANDATVTAQYIQVHSLTYTAGANGSITGTSPQTITHAADGAEITAVPADGYHFVNWSDASTANPRTDTNVTADITVTANFAINEYSLTYTAGANGSITGDTPQTVNHGTDGAEVIAASAEGYHFAGWSDLVVGDPRKMNPVRTDTNVTADVNATADFAINEHSLTYTAGANGSITGTTPQTVNYGTDGSTVTAAPADGYHFAGWSDLVVGDPRKMNPVRIDTNVAADVNATADFAINEYSLTYTAGANGSITGDTPQTVNHGASGTEVIATPADGYHFAGWSDLAVEDPNKMDSDRTDTNVTADVNATADFAINTYTVTFVEGANGTRTGGGELSQPITHGGSATVPIITPNTGWNFTGWDVAFNNITADLTVTAQYSIIQYTVSYIAGENGSIAGINPQGVDHGSDASTVTAVPNPGCRFVSWSDGIFTPERTDTNITGNLTVSAEFAVNQPNNLHFTAIADHTLAIAWDEPENPAYLGFKIYRNNKLIAETTSLHFVDAYVEKDVEYSYVVRLYDAQGISSLSSDTIVGTPGTFSSGTFYVDSANGNDSFNGLSKETAKKTIQNAVDTAAENNVIIVAPGNYTHFTLNKNLVITADSAKPEDTIISAADSAGITIDSNTIGQATLIEGFTISNSGTTSPAAFGGGILVNLGSPVISHCEINNNEALNGAGIAVTGTNAAPYIVKCKVTDNIAAGNGGGIYFAADTYPKIKNCYIQNNNAQNGAGIFGAGE